MADVVFERGDEVIGRGFICATGCCPGCQRCYGMQMGCHQIPCRCDRECSCDMREEEKDPYCLRHFDLLDDRPKESAPNWYSGKRCPICDPKREYIQDPDCKLCDGMGTIMMAPADYVTRCLERIKPKKPFGETICVYTAKAYIWPKRGPKRWKPVCGIHLKSYHTADNILEVS